MAYPIQYIQCTPLSCYRSKMNLVLRCYNTGHIILEYLNVVIRGPAWRFGQELRDQVRTCLRLTMCHVEASVAAEQTTVTGTSSSCRKRTQGEKAQCSNYGELEPTGLCYSHQEAAQTATELGATLAILAPSTQPWGRPSLEDFVGRSSVTIRRIAASVEDFDFRILCCRR